MESTSVCYRVSDYQNRTTAERESDLFIMGMIKDRIGRHEVLINAPITFKEFVMIMITSIIKTVSHQ